ncbi:Uncharacterised protein g4494 [Pycnogonum litorale]
MFGSMLTKESDDVYLTTNINYHLRRIELDVAIISIEDKGINDLESKSFDNFRKLEVILLPDNEIPSIGYSSFEFTSVEVNMVWKIDLSSNRISSIVSRAFRCLRNLRELILYHNSLQSICNHQFSGLNKLHYLDIGVNQLTSLGKTCLSDTIELRQLECSENMVTSLYRDTFSGLQHLNHLELSENSINEIENGAFDSLKSLQVLYINMNVLNNNSMNIVKALSGKLCIFEADDQPTKELSNCTSNNYDRTNEYHDASSFIDEMNVRRLGNLNYPRSNVRFFLHYRSNESKSIVLKNRGIDDLDIRSFRRFTKIALIDLCDNKMESVNRSTFEFLHGNNMNKLKLISNKISQIDEAAFNDMTKLRYLYLSHNRLTSLSTNLFRYLRVLKVLDIMANHIKHIGGKQFVNLNRLTELYLSRNRITSVEVDAFVGLADVNELYLDYNRIGCFYDGTFDPLLNLTLLKITYNRLGDNEIKQLANSLRRVNKKYFIYQDNRANENDCQKLSR